MERLRITSGASAVKTLENGASVSVRSLEPKRPVPSEVARHEASHGMACDEVVYITIIPSGNAKGQTQPDRLTATCAAAAAAMGYSGYGQDKFMTVYHLGVDWGIAKSASTSKLAGWHEEREELATILEERLTIGQPEVEEAIQNVKKRRQGIILVEVDIKKIGEKSRRYKTETYGGVVNLSDLLPEAPNTQN